MLFLYFLLTFALGQEPETEVEADETMIVEAHKDLELYVAPITMEIHSTEVEAIINKQATFRYASTYWRNAKFKNERGIYDPVTMHSDIKVYNIDTIEYVWDNCNYKRDAKKCAYLNNHMLLETHITVDDHQIVVNMILYRADLTVISASTFTSQSKIRWIKQQEQTVTMQSGLMGNQTVVHTPKEELPLKWLIPTNLMEKHISQAAIRTFAGARLN